MVRAKSLPGVPWISLNKRAVSVHFFQAAIPNQFSVMDRNIGAGVTHVLSAVRLKIYGLNNHKALCGCGSKEIQGIAVHSPQHF